MKKKILVITGANKGIGLETVKKFVDENWYVCACVRNISPELRSLIKNNGEIFNLELKSEDSIKTCAKSILSKFERVDTLINCAGIAYGNLFAMTKIQNLREVF
jgi:3-oxoacyl-[acyl-carrier protein] reductase